MSSISNNCTLSNSCIKKWITNRICWILIDPSKILMPQKTVRVQWQSLYFVQNHLILIWKKINKNKVTTFAVRSCCAIPCVATCPWLNDHQVNLQHSLSRQQNCHCHTLQRRWNYPWYEWRLRFFFFFFFIGFVDEWSSQISCRKQQC